MKVKETSDKSGWLIKCIACNCYHKFSKALWKFNGDDKKPTFDPSLLVKCYDSSHPHYDAFIGVAFCHLVIKEGRIFYLPSCTHPHKGKNYKLPNININEDYL